MPWRDAALGVLVASLWGINFIAAKIALEDFSPLIVSAVRFAIVGAMIVPFVPWPRGGQWRTLAVQSFILGTIHFAASFAALDLGLSVAATAVIIQLSTPFSVVMGVFFLGEKLGWRAITGLVLAFGGLLSVFGVPQVQDSMAGALMAVLAAFTFSVSSILAKRMPRVAPFAFTGWMALLAVPQILLVSVLIEDGQAAQVMGAQMQTWLAILYSVIGSTIMAYGLWFYLIERHSVSVVAPFTLLVPIFGTALAQFWLQEPLSLALLAGGGITLAGVGITLLRRPKVVTLPKEGL